MSSIGAYEKTRKRILEYSLKQFMTLGYSKVTMDEIVYGLGMSKGTLYRYFNSKEELLLSVITDFFQEIENEIQSIVLDKSLSPSEKLKTFLKNMVDRLSKLTPSIIGDIERNVPEAYNQIQKQRKDVILGSLTKLLKDGAESGIFRKDIDQNLVAYIIFTSIEYLSKPQFLINSTYTFSQMFNTVLLIVLQGNLTEEGRHLLDK